MTYLVTITSQGQISIPALFRRSLGLNKSRRAVVSLVGGKVIVEPVDDFMKLRGIFKSNRRYTVEEEERAIEEGIVADYR